MEVDMNCPFPDDGVKIIIEYLRHKGLTITKTNDSYHLCEGIPNINVIKQAFLDRAIGIAEDGSLHFCGIYLPSDWDTVRIRRRVEDHLRKVATTEDIIRIASCLGVKLG
jgi:hypothetical protein